MRRCMIAIRGFGLLFATPLAMFTAWDLADTILYASGPNLWPDIAVICCACAALLVLNAALLSSSATPGTPRLFVAHVLLAPPAAYMCHFGSVDPVALFLALPLLAGTIVMLGTSSCPVWRLAGRY